MLSSPCASFAPGMGGGLLTFGSAVGKDVMLAHCEQRIESPATADRCDHSSSWFLPKREPGWYWNDGGQGAAGASRLLFPPANGWAQCLLRRSPRDPAERASACTSGREDTPALWLSERLAVAAPLFRLRILAVYLEPRNDGEPGVTKSPRASSLFQTPYLGQEQFWRRRDTIAMVRRVR